MTYTTKTIAILALASFLAAGSEVNAHSYTSKIAVTAPAKTGKGRGLVKAIDLRAKTITLAHNNIPGIMMAMTMEYPVEKSSVCKGIHVGDSVTFTLKSTKAGEYVVSAIAIIPKK